MEDTKYIWAWVGGAVVVILIILGFWWWSSTRSGGNSTEQVGYASTTTDALSSPNAPTSAVGVEPGSGTVEQVLADLPQGTRFAPMLSASGVSLSGKGPYTVFVPTNASFELLPPGSLTLTAAQQKRLVEYHIVANRAIDINAVQSGTIQALSGDMLNFSIFSGDKSARVNSAVALHEYKATNGVVYVISEVLLPPINSNH